MLSKKKICEGCNQEQYIYKNIDGKKYCKSCTFKLQPPKSIKKVNEKQKFKIIIKKNLIEEDKIFYLKVWETKFSGIEGAFIEKTPSCEVCERSLSLEPNICNFHHILEKRNYPEYRHESWNIAILCQDCHSSYESNPDNIPYLKNKREELLGYFRWKSRVTFLK